MKRDKARVYTDRKLKELEDELSREYTRALDETRKKWDAYMERHKAKANALYEKLLAAERTGKRDAIAKAKEAYQKYLRQITLGDKKYRDMVARLSSDLAHVDQAAYRLVNNILPDIYAVNYNSLVEGLPTGYVFGLVDAKTVTNLVMKELNLLKDERWNRQRLNSEILQGILQGESMPKIAKRLEQFVGGNEAAAIRNARTAVTYAENQGRMDSMKEAADMGLIYEKQWISTHDSRTRESHVELDGATATLYEPFDNGLMCPGDPTGDGAEVYNCRCTMNRILVGIRKADGSIQYV